MDQFDTDPEKRLAALAERRAQIDRKLTEAREAHANLQEEALMQVPQELLGQVNGGTVEDFKAILAEMQSDDASALAAFSAKLDSFEQK